MHGYNVDWYAALGGAIAMEQMLNRGKKPSEKKITVVLFSWPSNGSMMPFAAYKSDRTDARDSGKAIGRALLKLKDFLGTLRIDAKNKNHNKRRDKQNLSIQQQLSVSQVYYKCAVLHNVSMEFKRNFLFVYFVYIVTKVYVALLVQTSNSHRTGS